MACDFHNWQLVSKTTERQAKKAMPLLGISAEKAVRVFRCAECGLHAEIPVSRRHEVGWTKKPKPGPLEDQLTIYDDVATDDSA